MAQDGKITITISDDRGSGGSKKSSNSKIKEETIKEPLDRIKDFANLYPVHETIHFLKQETMEMINHYVGTIGQRTGNYVAQQNVQMAFNSGRRMLGLGMTFLAGAKAFGPAAGLGAAALGAGLTVTNSIMGWYDLQRQIRINNNNVNLLRQRAGLGINNGSR